MRVFSRDAIGTLQAFLGHNGTRVCSLVLRTCCLNEHTKNQDVRGLPLSSDQQDGKLVRLMQS